jgi:hypothetical protein
MNDLQSKFAMTLVAFGLFFAYAFPMLKQAKQNDDAVVSQVGQVYIAPTPNDPDAPSGNVSINDLQKYAAKKAAERKARTLQF